MNVFSPKHWRTLLQVIFLRHSSTFLLQCRDLRLLLGDFLFRWSLRRLSRFCGVGSCVGGWCPGRPGARHSLCCGSCILHRRRRCRFQRVVRDPRARFRWRFLLFTRLPRRLRHGLTLVALRPRTRHPRVVPRKQYHGDAHPFPVQHFSASCLIWALTLKNTPARLPAQFPSRPLPPICKSPLHPCPRAPVHRYTLPMRSFAAFGATSRFLLLIFLISLGALAYGNGPVPSQIPSAPAQEASASASTASTQNSTTTYHLSPQK